jgi:hypothetical protein
MNQLVVLGYTVGGGVIGAGLNQYVTNIGQRRTARAAVVEKVSEVEASYAKIVLPGGSSADNDIVRELHTKMEQHLHALEGAGLIAGIPRGILSTYITTCRMTDTFNEVKSAVTALGNEVEKHVKPRLGTFIDSKGPGISDDDREYADYATGKAGEMLQQCRTSLEEIKDAEKATSGYHDAALDALRVSLWNPIVSKFRWRKHQDLRRIDEELERDRRSLSAAAQETREKKEALNKIFDELAAAPAGRADT